jgi:hypothetical protein
MVKRQFVHLPRGPSNRTPRSMCDGSCLITSCWTKGAAKVSSCRRDSSSVTAGSKLGEQRDCMTVSYGVEAGGIKGLYDNESWGRSWWNKGIV